MTAEDNLFEVLKRARAGEPCDADLLAATARPEIFRLARAIVHDPSLVDDVVQEALLEVLATYAALRTPEAARAWLRMIIRKQADRATRGIRPAPTPLDTARADVADGPERLSERLGQVASVRRALATVRDADALLLRLRYLGEWTDAELADLVGVSPGTVRKRLFDARQRLRAAVIASPPPHLTTNKEPNMTDIDRLLGRVVSPADIGAAEPFQGSPSGLRLETGIKILDAVLPVERGGTVDLLGPFGLGQLVLVAEIAAHVGGVVVAAGTGAFANLVDDDVSVPAMVIDGDPSAAGAAADRAAALLASAGRSVLLVSEAATWASTRPASGVAATGAGSITALRFAPHREGAPSVPIDDAGTTLVFAMAAFLEGHHPAIDVVASRSLLIENDALDGVTVGTARAAREALRRANGVRSFLAQALIVGETYTGIPAEAVTAREATEGLAALVR